MGVWPQPRLREGMVAVRLNAIVLAVFAGRLQIQVVDSIDPKIREMVQRHIESEPNSRSSKALRVMLEKGSVTTADLTDLGYDHPPRAIGDVRDAGIPVVREMIRGANGKRMARYRLGNARIFRRIGMVAARPCPRPSGPNCWLAMARPTALPESGWTRVCFR